MKALLDGQLDADSDTELSGMVAIIFIILW
jgi:hypothetical protein